MSRTVTDLVFVLAAFVLCNCAGQAQRMAEGTFIELALYRE